MRSRASPALRNQGNGSTLVNQQLHQLLRRRPAPCARCSPTRHETCSTCFVAEKSPRGARELRLMSPQTRGVLQMVPISWCGKGETLRRSAPPPSPPPAACVGGHGRVTSWKIHRGTNSPEHGRCHIVSLMLVAAGGGAYPGTWNPAPQRQRSSPELRVDGELINTERTCGE